MKKIVSGTRYRPGILVTAFLVLGACSRIGIDRGPFPITFDEELIAAKQQLLDKLPHMQRGDSLPNIVLILVDDLGKFDISTYGPEGVPTPGLDRLAEQGVRFSSAYSTSPVCSPSRAALLTGRYQQRFGFERQPMNRYPMGKLEYWIVDHWVNTAPMQLLNPMANPGKKQIEKQGIPPEEILLQEILQARGYRTGIFGKWHLGSREPFLPNQRGFDEQYGFYEAFTLYADEKNPEIINYRHDYFANKHIWRQKRKGSCAIRENDREIREKQYLTFSIADRACSFMEENQGSPFFLYIPFSAPHTPFQVPRTYFEKFSHVEDRNKRVYYGMISALDDAVQQITGTIDSLGLRDNTIIMLASDNGGATYTGATDNGILKGGKFSQFEGGINIPMIFSWKGVLPAGSVYDGPVSLMDIFSTALSVSGSEIPVDRACDGVDLMPYLKGERSTLPHDALFWRTDFNKAVRSGPWKLIWNERDDQLFLYNLERDLPELDNQALSNPGKAEELKKMILEWEKEMKPPRWPGVMQFEFNINGETTWWSI